MAKISGWSGRVKIENEDFAGGRLVEEHTLMENLCDLMILDCSYPLPNLVGDAVEEQWLC